MTTHSRRAMPMATLLEARQPVVLMHTAQSPTERQALRNIGEAFEASFFENSNQRLDPTEHLPIAFGLRVPRQWHAMGWPWIQVNHAATGAAHRGMHFRVSRGLQLHLPEGEALAKAKRIAVTPSRPSLLPPVDALNAGTLTVYILPPSEENAAFLGIDVLAWIRKQTELANSWFPDREKEVIVRMRDASNSPEEALIRGHVFLGFDSYMLIDALLAGRFVRADAAFHPIKGHCQGSFNLPMQLPQALETQMQWRNHLVDLLLVAQLPLHSLTDREAVLRVLGG